MYSLLYFYFHSTKIRQLLKTLRYTQTLGPTMTPVLGMQGKKKRRKNFKSRLDQCIKPSPIVTSLKIDMCRYFN